MFHEALRSPKRRKMVAFGFAATSLAFFGYSRMNLDSGTWDILWYQINQGVGMSFVFVPLTTLTMGPIPRAETGYATSLYSVMRNIGPSMGISFGTTWVARQSQAHETVLAAHVTATNPQTQQATAQLQQWFLQAGADQVTASRQTLAALYGLVQQQAALLSYEGVFRLMGLLFLAVIPWCFSCSGPKPRPARRWPTELQGTSKRPRRFQD